MSRAFIQRIQARAPHVPFLDTRSAAQFEQQHVVGSSNIPADALHARSAELPPKGCSMWVLAEPSSCTAVAAMLNKLGYTHNELVSSSDEFWAAAKEFRCTTHGTQSKRMWRPNAFLQQCLPLIDSRLATSSRRALDLACGSGRDAVYLSENGWTVTAVDYQAKLLEKCRKFAEAAGVPVPVLKEMDIESLHKESPIHTILSGFDLIHVSRYLHRPLLPSLIEMLNPGGFIVYSTFMQGCEVFGKPRNSKHILEPGELKQVFSDFVVFDYREARIDDLRPLQYLCAQKLPADVSYEDLVQTAIRAPHRRKIIAQQQQRDRLREEKQRVVVAESSTTSTVKESSTTTKAAAAPAPN